MQRGDKIGQEFAEDGPRLEGGGKTQSEEGSGNHQ